MNSSSRVRRTSRRSVPVLALACAIAAGLLSACSFSIQDAQCGGGQYPVLAVGSSGSDCVDNGQEPPKGYARYPEGKVPEHVGDQWDEYWSTRTLDENGKIITIPEGQRTGLFLTDIDDPLTTSLQTPGEFAGES